MTECAPGCGACCDPVKLRFSVEAMTGPSAPFAREHWTLIEARECAEGTEYRVRCDVFDPATRRCTAHADRPPICSGYPWYGAEPDPERGRTLDLVCSFQADVRTVLPIVQVNGRAA